MRFLLSLFFFTAAQPWWLADPTSQAAHAAAAGMPVLPKGLIASLDAYGAIKPLGSTSIWDPAARRGGDVFQYRLPVELSVEKQKGTKEGFFLSPDIAAYRTVW